jgi:hypothetical protein
MLLDLHVTSTAGHTVVRVAVRALVSAHPTRHTPQDPRQPSRGEPPAFAVQALRAYQQVHQQRTPLRLLLVQPGQAPRPVELDLLLRTERDTPVRPEHASRTFRAFAQSRRDPGASPSAAPFAGTHLEALRLGQRGALTISGIRELLQRRGDQADIPGLHPTGSVTPSRMSGCAWAATRPT